LKEGWPQDNYSQEVQNLDAAGVVDWFIISHYIASAEVDLFLRIDLKDLRLFLLKRFLIFIVIRIK
jgi:hypothetical protein